VPGSSARQWILGYNHHLSKRTKLYAAYTRIDNGISAWPMAITSRVAWAMGKMPAA
jgi:predicted porin